MRTIAIAVSLCAASALAATISGTVYDPSGAVVPNADVTVQDRANGNVQKTATNESGQFQFATLPASAYVVEVRAAGFRQAREAVKIGSATGAARADVVLQLGAIREAIEIHRETAGPGAAIPGPVKLRVGGNVQPARLLKMVRPTYPASTAASGPVLLRGTVLRDGTLGNLIVLAAPDEQLAAAALDALRQWRYQPVLLNGQPVEAETEVRLEYATAR